jgi:integrase/recombinase XerD
VRDHGIAVGVRVSPQGLRHACATHLLAGGADVRHVQQLSATIAPRTTALYTRVEIGDLREVLGAHPRSGER